MDLEKVSLRKEREVRAPFPDLVKKWDGGYNYH